MDIKRSLIKRLQALKSTGGRWNFGQQQLYCALNGKRNLWAVRFCAKCLEEVGGAQTHHSCGEVVLELQIKEPKKVPGGYVFAWQ